MSQTLHTVPAGTCSPVFLMEPITRKVSTLFGCDGTDSDAPTYLAANTDVHGAIKVRVDYPKGGGQRVSLQLWVWLFNRTVLDPMQDDERDPAWEIQQIYRVETPRGRPENVAIAREELADLLTQDWPIPLLPDTPLTGVVRLILRRGVSSDDIRVKLNPTDDLLGQRDEFLAPRWEFTGFDGDTGYLRAQELANLAVPVAVADAAYRRTTGGELVLH